LDANDSSGITLSDQDVAEWRDKSGNGYDMVAQGHPKLAEYGYGTGLKVVHFESAAQSKSDKKAGGDALYSEKKWDTSTGDFTMFAVARYAADEEEWYKNNFVISDRSAKNTWLFGFGYNILGFTLLGWEGWENVSRVTQEMHDILIPGAVAVDDVFRVTISGTDCNFTATSNVKADIFTGIGDAIESEFPTVFNIFKWADRIRLTSRTPEITRRVTSSSNLSITPYPPNGV